MSAPPNARDTSSLPPEHSTWHRESYNKDPRVDRGVERDRVGAGKRTWSGDRSSTVGSFQGASGGGSMSGNGYVPRSKPRFQGALSFYLLVLYIYFYIFEFKSRMSYFLPCRSISYLGPLSACDAILLKQVDLYVLSEPVG